MSRCECCLKDRAPSLWWWLCQLLSRAITCVRCRVPSNVCSTRPSHRSHAHAVGMVKWPVAVAFQASLNFEIPSGGCRATKKTKWCGWVAVFAFFRVGVKAIPSQSRNLFQFPFMGDCQPMGCLIWFPIWEESRSKGLYTNFPNGTSSCIHI